MNIWLAIVLVGFGSYLFRAGPLLLGVAALPPLVQRAVGYAGTGALTALIVTGVARHAPDRAAAAVAVVVAAAVAGRGVKMLGVVAGGLAAYVAAGAVL